MFDGVCVRLIPMDEHDFRDLCARTVSLHAEVERDVGKWPIDVARQRSCAQLEALLPAGITTPHHFFFSILNIVTGSKVGSIWIGEQSGSGQGVYLIFDLFIEEVNRRCGFASASIRLIESIVLDMGGHTIKLQVFAKNLLAKTLYEKMAYSTYSHSMSKRIVHSKVNQ
jgi:Acetyltransferase (GNAT) family